MMLNVNHIQAQYDKVSALRDVTIKVDQGELVCILGANGAGKTSLLKTIIGILRPVEGSISFEGKPISTLRTHEIIKRGISIIPEGRQLFPKMSILENLKMGAYFEDDEKTITKRVETVTALFPKLRERLGQLAGTLSGGEQAMVAICRGLMSQPKLLLMDEPSLGLAPKLVEEYFSAISRINREGGTTILLVEQNAKKALSISARGYILQKGEIILEGTSRSLLDSEIVKGAYL